MKTVKMSLANIQGKLSRVEMKSIMAGSGDGSGAKVQCCWTGTSNCSSCVPNGYYSCSQGASLYFC